MVEFALVAPVAFLLLIGLVVLGIAVMNQVALSNAVRDSARAAAVCGGATGRGNDSVTDGTTQQLPNGQQCSAANLQSYISSRLNSLPGGSASAPAVSGANCATSGLAVICVYDASGNAVSLSGSTPLDACAKGYKIDVSSQFSQPLYLPLIGRLLGTNGGSSRTLSADASATCEQ